MDGSYETLAAESFLVRKAVLVVCWIACHAKSALGANSVVQLTSAYGSNQPLGILARKICIRQCSFA